MLSRITELEGLNEVLISLKQSPTTTLNATFGVDGEAKAALDAAARDILSERWSFNTSQFTARADANGEIRLPDAVVAARVLRNEPFHGQGRYTLSGNRIFDRLNSTYEFTPGSTLVVDITKLIPWNDRPDYANRLIIAKAARDFNRKSIGNAQVDAGLEQLYVEARHRFEATEVASNPANSFDGSGFEGRRNPRAALFGYY